MRDIKPETGVCFFRVAENARLSEFLGSADYSPLTVNTAKISEWLEYGCIYVNGLRQRQDVEVRPGEVLRVHTRRKSFTGHDNLRARIVCEEPEFLVLDKPSGLPTHPTLDNFLENAKVQLEVELGIPIYTTHRLDVPTQGLLLFAKTPAAQKSLNRAFSLRRVEKIYRSINPRSVPLGRHVHYMDPLGRVPRHVQSEENPNWWRCELEVLHSEQLADDYWHEIKLLTGKTHQIRAQMAHLGAPISGDHTYSGSGAEKTAAAERIALECFRLSFAFRSRPFTISRPQSIVSPNPSSHE